MRTWLAIICTLALCGGVARADDSVLSRSGLDMFGRTSDQPAISNSGGGNSLLGVFKSDRFHISNETSFSVFSGGGSSMSQGLNVTRLTYGQPHSPLSLSLGVGNVFMSSGSYLGYSAKPGFFLHDLSLQYRAGEHSIISVQFQQFPTRRSSPYDVSGYGYDPLQPGAPH